MQDRPTAAELLTAIGDLLNDEVLGAVDGPLKHKVRVAANLCRILAREQALGGTHDMNARATLMALLDSPDTEILSLLAALDARLQDGGDAFERAAWPVVLDIVRGKLAIDKPRHDDYDFAVDLEP